MCELERVFRECVGFFCSMSVTYVATYVQHMCTYVQHICGTVVTVVAQTVYFVSASD